MKSQKTIQMAEIALMSAVLCVFAPFTIPIPVSPVPFSLATVAVYLAGALLGAKKGVACVIVYLLLGMMGLPVFSGFSGGVGVLLGPTGGYLVGYIPCVFVTGRLLERGWSFMQKKKCFGVEGKAARSWWRVVWNTFAMALGTILCYALGTTWFLFVMDGTYTVMQALLVCVVPYVAFDMIKILAVAVIAVPIRKILRRIER